MLREGHPFRQLAKCVSALCVHKEKCNTCGVIGHLYGTQALHPGRWKINNKGRCGINNVSSITNVLRPTVAKQ